MTPKQASDYFGRLARLADALEVSLQVVSNWKRRGHIPLAQQIELYRITDGELKLDRKRRRNGQA